MPAIEGRALLDTGATISGIRQSVADALNLRPIGKRPLASAHGQWNADRYVFSIGFAPDHAPDEPAGFPYLFEAVSGFGLNNSFGFEALIGMDILSECAFAMARDGRCRLSFGSER